MTSNSLVGQPIANLVVRPSSVDPIERSLNQLSTRMVWYMEFPIVTEVYLISVHFGVSVYMYAHMHVGVHSGQKGDWCNGAGVTGDCEAS